MMLCQAIILLAVTKEITFAAVAFIVCDVACIHL